MFLDDIVGIVDISNKNNLLYWLKSSIFDMIFLWRNNYLCSVSVCHFVYKFLFHHLDDKKYSSTSYQRKRIYTEDFMNRFYI